MKSRFAGALQNQWQFFLGLGYIELAQVRSWIKFESTYHVCAAKGRSSYQRRRRSAPLLLRIRERILSQCGKGKKGKASGNKVNRQALALAGLGRRRKRRRQRRKRRRRRRCRQRRANLAQRQMLRMAVLVHIALQRVPIARRIDGVRE